MCWIWLIAIIGFFTIPNSKIIGYALPVMPPLALLAALGWDNAMARLKLGAPAQGRWFAGLCAVSIAIAVAVNVTAARYTVKYGTQDVALALEALGVEPSDTVYLLGEFAYDLPFYRQASTPMVVIQDWRRLRKSAGDDWQHELLEGADFDVSSADVLQTPKALIQERTLNKSGVWLLAPNNVQVDGLVPVFEGNSWSLYQAGPLAVKPAPSQRLKAQKRLRRKV